MAVHTSSFEIAVGGAPLPADVEELLVSAVVDDSINVPDMFVLTFRDTDRTVLKKGGFEVGATVVIKVVSDAAAGGEHLMTGEITALEAEYTDAGTTTVVRGLDHSHRLHRGRVNRTYVQVTAADIARTVADRAGLALGEVTATTERLSHVSQADESDWEFLRRLGRETGRILAVTEGKLHFRANRPVSGAPAPARLGARDPFQLTVGQNLLSVRAVISAAEQVAKVEVRGFDQVQEKAVVAIASAATTAASLATVTPAGLAASFEGGTLVASRVPYKTQGRVENAAKAWADELGGAFAELAGRAEGSPRLAAGQPVSLGMMDEPFDGRYVLTSTRHEWVPARGYHTDFVASGRHERTLLGLTTGGRAQTGRVPGLMFAVVTAANDPDMLGRVKVKLPSLADDFETDWCTVLYPGAGGRPKDYGLFLVPEVGDVVVVGFELGDIDHPVIVGGVYNQRRKPPLTGNDHVDTGSGQVNSRVLRARSGNRLLLEDKPGDTQEIGLHSDDEQMVVQLLTGKRVIRIVCDRDVEIEAGGDVKVKATGSVAVEARGNATVKATGSLKMEGATVAIKSNGPVEVSGNPIKLN